MPNVTRALYPLAIQLVLLVNPASAQSLRISEDPDELARRAAADSNDPVAHYNAAIGWWSRQRWERADSALALALRLDPSFAPAWLARAIVQERNEDYWRRIRRQAGDTGVVAEARRRDGYFRRAFLVDPFVDVRVLGSIVRRGYRSTAFSRGVEYLVEGQYAPAYERLEEALRGEARRGLDSVPELLLWFHQLAASRSGHLQEAIADVEALLRQTLARERGDTSHAVPLVTNEYRYLRAALHQRMGRRGEAMQFYREVLEHDVSNYVAHSQLARLHESAGDTAAALLEWRRAAETNPDDHTLLLDLGTALSRAGRLAEADEVLVRAGQAGPRDYRIFYRLGLARQGQRRNAEAREAFERFIALAPSRLATAVADARARIAALND